MEASCVQPLKANTPAHDSLNRMLHRQELNTEDLWQEAKPQVSRSESLLWLDDATLEKPYAKQIDLVCRHWSGKHHQTVRGINLTGV